MSLRPGSRWTPSTQGIAGGIGSAFAGVSDQIRRVMQDRPATPAAGQVGGYGTAESGWLDLSPGYAAWDIPAAAVDGKTMMTVHVGCRNLGAGVEIIEMGVGGRQWLSPRVVQGASASDQVVVPVLPGVPFDVSVYVGPVISPSAEAYFTVYAW